MGKKREITKKNALIVDSKPKWKDLCLLEITKEFDELGITKRCFESWVMDQFCIQGFVSDYTAKIKYSCGDKKESLKENLKIVMEELKNKDTYEYSHKRGPFEFYMRWERLHLSGLEDKIKLKQREIEELDWCIKNEHVVLNAMENIKYKFKEDKIDDQLCFKIALYVTKERAEAAKLTRLGLWDWDNENDRKTAYNAFLNKHL